MSPTTPNFGIAYPGSDEPIAQGAETIRQGMERVDGVLHGDAIQHFTNIGAQTQTGWGRTGMTQEAWVDGARTYLFVELRRAGPSITPNATGGIGAHVLFQLTNERHQPIRSQSFSFIYRSQTATYGGTGEVHPEGNVQLISITPGTEITSRETDWSIRITCDYLWRAP